MVVLPTERESSDDPMVLVTVEAELSLAKSARRQSTLPVFDVRHNQRRYRADPRQLYTVDHWVSELKGGATYDRFSFDFRAANAEIFRAFDREA